MNKKPKPFGNYRLMTEIAIEEFIDMCRREEIKFRKGDFDLTDRLNNISGVDHLSEALRSGIIAMENYIDILPAVINPEAPYEFKLRDND